MKKLKWFLISSTVLASLLMFVGVPLMKNETKKHSPEKKTEYDQNGFNMRVTYSSPSKKGRDIFGELVPYGAIWRTGANEPTTFTTNADIEVIDKKLPKGTYSLWTVPNKNSWKVIFNKEIPDWGVTLLSGGKETTHNAGADVLIVEVPARAIAEPVEALTIHLTHRSPLELVISWDKVKITVPLNKDGIER